MPIVFKLYTDANLTQEFDWDSGAKLTFSENGSGVLYFGSTVTTHKCQKSGGGNFNITPTDAVPEWAAATAKVLNAEIQPTTDLGYYFKCTSAGTTGGTEPNWASAPNAGDTIVDGTVTWTNQGPHHEATEIKLADTSGGLAAATPGAALTITAPVLGGVGNAVQIHYQLTDGAGGGVEQSNLSFLFDVLEQRAV